MKWIWLLAAFVVTGIMTCNIKEANDWLARQPAQQDQIQTAMDILQGSPTAAGKKK